MGNEGAWVCVGKCCGESEERKKIKVCVKVLWDHGI